MPPKPVLGDPSGCRQLSENPGSCHKTNGLRNKNTHSPAVTKLFSIYFAAIQHLLFKLQIPNISSFLFEYVFHRTSDPHLRSFQIENVGNGCRYIELHHALLKFRNPFDVLPENNKRRFELLKRLSTMTFPDTSVVGTYDDNGIVPYVFCQSSRARYNSIAKPHPATDRISR